MQGKPTMESGGPETRMAIRRVRQFEIDERIAHDLHIGEMRQEDRDALDEDFARQWQAYELATGGIVPTIVRRHVPQEMIPVEYARQILEDEPTPFPWWLYTRAALFALFAAYVFVNRQ